MVKPSDEYTEKMIKYVTFFTENMMNAVAKEAPCFSEDHSMMIMTFTKRMALLEMSIASVMMSISKTIVHDKAEHTDEMMDAMLENIKRGYKKSARVEFSFEKKSDTCLPMI